MRLAVLIIGWLFCPIAWASGPGLSDRVAVVVALDQPTPEVASVVDAHAQASTLVETLRHQGEYGDVRALIGSTADADTVLDTVRSAMTDLAPDGVLLFVFLGHGAGGDFGEPALLTHGATLDAPASTGVDVAALSQALRPRSDGQHVVVIVDALHLGSVDGVALIGPTASGWPHLAKSGVTVVTPTVSGWGVQQDGLIPVVARGLAGHADDNGDKSVTLAELLRYTGAELQDSSGSLVETVGPRKSDRVVGGLAGLFYGMKSIPNEWIDEIARKEDIEELTNKLSDKYKIARC